MKKSIVITSIFPPTTAVIEFSKKKDWNLIVVGDKKTPPGWKSEGVTYISPEDQNKDYGDISNAIPWNNYARKIIGYTCAIRNGADYIADSDDDNFPYKNWGIINQYRIADSSETLKIVNIYKLFSKQNIWPRGYPLELVKSEFDRKLKKVGIWQGLVDGDTDVDAIYRLTSNMPVKFDAGDPVVLSKGSFCPINSQNTIFHKDLFPLMYLPSTVTMRFTDILRGYIAQIVAWQYNFQVCFLPPSAFQKRNEHDYLKDFEQELPFLTNASTIINIIDKSTKSGVKIQENIRLVYAALAKEKIVDEIELKYLDLWLNEFK